MNTTVDNTPFSFENTRYVDLKVGDLVLADPVYGAEEVMAIQDQHIQEQQIIPGAELVLRIQLEHPLRGGNHRFRMVARFPHEACVRITRGATWDS